MQRWFEKPKGAKSIEQRGLPAFAGSSMRLSDKVHQSIVSAIAEGIVFQAADGEILASNKSAERILGLTSDQLHGRTSLDPRWRAIRQDGTPFPGEEHPAMVTLRTGLPLSDVVMGVHKPDGQLSWILINSEPVYRDDESKPCGVVCSFSDFTARKLAEDRLRESERRLAEAQQIARMGSWEWTAATGKVWWSKSICDLFGVNSETVEPSYESFLSLVHPDDRVIADRRVAAMHGGIDTFANELRIIRPDGELLWINSRARATRDETGNIVRIEGIDQDITDRKLIEEHLRQSQKMDAIGRLAGGVAHDFNNLLTVINCHAEMLLHNVGHNAPERQHYEAIRYAGQRAAELTAQLLTFSRKTLVKPKEVDLNQIIRAAGHLVERFIREDIVLEFVLDANLEPIMVDVGQIEQVLVNLVVNARDAMPAGGNLRIATYNWSIDRRNSPYYPELPEGRYVALQVTDNGLGMSEETKSKIFEPFFTTKELGKGTGLGLAVVHGVVKQCGGQVSVRTEIGLGTSFELLFPVATHNQTPSTVHTTMQDGRGNETILIVEDEAAVRDIARSVLESFGYSVIVAENGNAALRILQAIESRVQLLLTDVIMPEMGGRHLADEVRKLHPELPILFMSGHTDDTLSDLALSECRDAFIQKPFTPSGLVQRIRALLDADRSQIRLH